MGGSGHGSYPGDLLLRHATQAAVELQVLPAREQVRDGIELRAVAHVLVDGLQVGQHAAGRGARDRVSTLRGQGTSCGDRGRAAGIEDKPQGQR